MRVKCIKNYFDKELNKNVAIGESFQVTDARANVLIAANVCEAVEPEVEEEPTKAAEPTEPHTESEKAAEPADKPAKRTAKKK